MSKFYDRSAWKRARKVVLIDADHRCQSCGNPIFGRNAHVHHRIKLKDAPALALVRANHRALCRKCHGLEEQGPRGCDLDGRPIDPAHPWNCTRWDYG